MIQYKKPYETTMERVRRERAERFATVEAKETKEQNNRKEFIGMCVLVPLVFFGMLALYALLAPIRP